MRRERDFDDDFERELEHDFRAVGAAAPFPGEHEWLSLPAPPVAADFVARTLFALAEDRRAAGGRDPIEVDAEEVDSENPESEDPDAGDLGLSAAQLATFSPAPPSPDFVDRTLRRLDDDRRTRWQEMLARYVAPEPSPAFVQRTLAALAEERPALRRALAPAAAPAWRRRVLPALPWLAAAAAVLWFVWLRQPDAAPFERRVADHVDAWFQHADSPTPLPALLAQLAHDEAPQALSTGIADGYWLAAAATEAR